MEIKIVPRDPELMELTRKIIQQNEIILKMNGQLLTLLSMATIVEGGLNNGVDDAR